MNGSRLFQWVGEFRDTVKHYAALLRETMDATAHAGGDGDFEGEITMKVGNGQWAMGNDI